MDKLDEEYSRLSLLDIIKRELEEKNTPSFESSPEEFKRDTQKYIRDSSYPRADLIKKAEAVVRRVLAKDQELILQQINESGSFRVNPERPFYLAKETSDGKMILVVHVSKKGEISERSRLKELVYEVTDGQIVRRR